MWRVARWRAAWPRLREGSSTATAPAARAARRRTKSRGAPAAAKAIEDAAKALGIGRPVFRREDALSILEHIAQQPGLIGVTARLAKSRLRTQKLVRSGRS